MREYRGVGIAYEDNHLLIAVKPPNMPTQADESGDPDLLTTMKDYVREVYAKPGAVYLGLIHRLDRPVGGLVALARTSKAAARLSDQVRQKTLARGYLAVARGQAPQEATLCDWLLKDNARNMVRVVPSNTPGAKEARLRCFACAGRDGLSLVRVQLYTGRSHQIRVQLQHAGLPLWGDARYGGGRPGEQIALWGAFLCLTHPTKGERLRFYAPPPAAVSPWRLFDLPQDFPELDVSDGPTAR